MQPEDFIRSKVGSPLGERSIHLRGRLLVTAISAVLITHANLIPTQIEGLGVTFDAHNQNALLSILAVVIGYFLVAFSVSAISDFYVAKLARKAHIENELQKEGFLAGGWPEVSNRLRETMYPLEVSELFVNRLQTYRLLLDVALPIVVGVYGIGSIVYILSCK